MFFREYQNEVFPLKRNIQLGKWNVDFYIYMDKDVFYIDSCFAYQEV